MTFKSKPFILTQYISEINIIKVYFSLRCTSVYANGIGEKVLWNCMRQEIRQKTKLTENILQISLKRC